MVAGYLIEIPCEHGMHDDAGVSEMEDYVGGLPPEQEPPSNVRAVVEEVAPEAEQGVSYGMPAYLHAGRPLPG